MAKKEEHNEIVASLSKLKMGKAPGREVENMRIVRHWVVRIMNIYYKCMKVPIDWQRARIVPLHKGKPDRDWQRARIVPLHKGKPDRDWQRARIVPLHKEKPDRNECKN